MCTSLFKCTILGLALSGTVMAQDVTVTTTTTVEESQDRYKVITNRFKDNWFIGIGGGAQVYWGKNDDKLSLSKRVTPTANIFVGKWFTPGFGVRLGADFAQAKGLTLAEQASGTAQERWYLDFYNSGKAYEADGVVYNEQKIKYGLFTASAMLNLSNMLCGYNPDRFYNFIPYAGAAAIVSDKKGGGHEHEFALTAGLLNTFRLSNLFSISLDLKGALFNQTFSHKYLPNVNDPADSDQITSATLGLVYRFSGERNWKKPRQVTTVIKHSEEEVDMLRNRVNALAKANEELTNQLAAGGSSKQARVQLEKEIAAMPLLITFPISKSTVDNTARVNLSFLAKVIKDNPKISYTVTGYADRGTGTPTLNKRLSEARAKAVFDVLTKEFGVDPAQLSIAYEGGIDNMFYDDPRLSRAVITVLKK